jgi:hypothetical protein
MPFPPAFTNVWDTTFPPDTQAANLLGQDLRNFRTDIMQRMSLLSGLFANRPTPEIVNAVWGGAGFGLVYFSTDTGQLFQWNGAAWVDISNTLKNPVVKIDLVAQQADIVATLLTIPLINGFYRAAAYVVLTQAATVSSTVPPISISWSDADLNAAESSQITSANNTNVVASISAPTLQPLVFFAKAGAAISLFTAGYASNGATPMQFALHLRLEGPF